MPKRVRMMLLAAALVLTLLLSLGTLVSFWRQDYLLGKELAKREEIYKALQDKHLDVLRETKQLKEDSDFQKRFLKEEFGYVEKDQIPIITSEEKGKSAPEDNKGE
ncbi:MAG: hypothetical protein HRF49_11200 [bacterium]|jgi:hypothetical protein